MHGKFLLLVYGIFGLLIAGLAARNGALIAMAVPLAVYLGVGLATRPTELRLQATRTLSGDFSAEGCPVNVSLVLHNEGEAIAELLVEDLAPSRLPLMDGKTSRLAALPRGASLELAYTLEARRGVFTFPQVRVTARDAFGLFSRTASLPTSGRLVVMPRVTRVRRPIIRPLRTHGFAGPIPARQAGSGTEFYGLREYQLGDPRRRINWRVSAHHERELFTNEFEQERIANVGLILDARDQSNVESGDASLFEFSIQATASLAEAFLAQGNRVGLLVYGFGMLRTFPGYGKVQLERILRSLAEARTGHNYALEKLDYLPTQFFPAHSQIVMVSPLLQTDLPTLVRLRALGYQLLVVSPDPVSFEARSLLALPEDEAAVRLARVERALLIHELKRVGVQTVDWRVDQPFNRAIESALSRPPQAIRPLGGRL